MLGSMPSQETIQGRLVWRPGQPRTWPIESVTVEIDPEIDRLTVVSDLHAYREPLDGVDRCLQSLPGTHAVFVNGDLFEGGIDPAETLEWVRRHATGRTTRGNHDSLVFAYLQNLALEDASDHWTRDAELGGYKRLSPDQLQFVAELPDQFLVRWREKTICILHGHQNHGNTDYTDWKSTPDQLMALFHEPEVDGTVIGHTHYPFFRKQSSSFLANSGSVAVPIQRFRTADGVVTDRDEQENLRAKQPVQSSLLSISEDDGELDVEIVYFDYDRAGLLERYAGQDDLLIPFPTRKTWIQEGFLDIGPLAATQRGAKSS